MNKYKLYFKLNLNFKKNIKTVLVLSIIFISIILITNYSTILLDYFDKSFNKNIDSRTIVFNVDDNSIVDKVNKINHVNQVAYFNRDEIAIDLEKYYISIKGINEKELKNIDVVDGKKEIGDGKIICPKNIYDDENNNFIDSKSILNQKLIDVENEYEYIDAYNKKKIGSREFDFTIVANYDAKEYANELNTCYGSLDDVYKIYKYIIDHDRDEAISDIEYSLIVDDYKNVNYVLNELKKLDTKNVSRVVFLDKFKVLLMILLPVIILIINMFLISTFIKHMMERKIEKEKKNIHLMKSIGYKDDNILMIYKSGYIILIIFSIILSIILSNIIFNLIANNLERIDEYSVLTFKINKLTTLFVIILLYLYSNHIINKYIENILNKKRIQI